MSGKHLSALTGLWIAVLVVYVYTHSGERAGSRCEGAVFTPGGSWSWSHFATECTYGLPPQVTYVRGLGFLIVLILTAVWLYSVVASLRSD